MVFSKIDLLVFKMI